MVIPDAYTTGAVTKVQFENTNVKLGTAGCKNRWVLMLKLVAVFNSTSIYRWVIEFNDFLNRNKIIKKGLLVNYFITQKSSDGNLCF